MHATSYINPHRNYGGKVSLVPAGVSLTTTPSERTPYNNELALYPAYRYTTSTITAPRPALLTDLDVTSLLRDVPASPVEERFSAHCGSLRFPTGKSLQCRSYTGFYLHSVIFITKQLTLGQNEITLKREIRVPCPHYGIPIH